MHILNALLACLAYIHFIWSLTMTHIKQSPRFILLLLSIFISVMPTLSLAEKTSATTLQNSGFKKTFCSYWRQYYTFRRDVVYPLNHYGSLIQTAIESKSHVSLHNLRVNAGYNNKACDILKIKEPMVTSCFIVGIIDALMAEKPAENIAKDDIVKYICHHGCLIGLKKLADQQGLPITQNGFTQASWSVISNIIANKFTDLIGEPIGNIAFKAIRCYKHGRKPADQCEW